MLVCVTYDLDHDDANDDAMKSMQPHNHILCRVKLFTSENSNIDPLSVGACVSWRGGGGVVRVQCSPEQ